MQRIQWNNLFFLMFILTASALYLSGVPGVPFHPDESTQWYMSGEITTLLTKPDTLYWSAQKEGDPRQHYRTIDAPGVRYAIEAIRALAGLPMLPADWDWSLSWEQNRANGALPDRDALNTIRFGLALPFAVDLALIYDIGRRIHGRLAGWLAAALLAGNALVLLHTRRVMAEGVLLMTVLLATWVMLAWRKRAWLSAAPAALAFCCKHSGVVLLVPGLLAAFWGYPKKPQAVWRGIAIAGFLALFAGVALALNPFLWSNPVLAALDVWATRSHLTTEMTGMFSQVSPGSTMNTVPQKVIAVGAQLFFTQPAVMDVANYHSELKTEESAYLGNPLHHLLRGLTGGGLALSLSLFGIILAIKNILQKGARCCRERALLLAATLAWLTLFSVSVPIPFQRYYLPLAPYACLWAAYGLADILQVVYKAR